MPGYEAIILTDCSDDDEPPCMLLYNVYSLHLPFNTAKHPHLEPVVKIGKIWLYPADVALLDADNNLNCKVRVR